MGWEVLMELLPELWSMTGAALVGTEGDASEDADRGGSTKDEFANNAGEFTLELEPIQARGGIVRLFFLQR